jgi:hypothetical protein
MEPLMLCDRDFHRVFRKWRFPDLPGMCVNRDFEGVLRLGGRLDKLEFPRWPGVSHRHRHTDGELQGFLQVTAHPQSGLDRVGGTSVRKSTPLAPAVAVFRDELDSVRTHDGRRCEDGADGRSAGLGGFAAK